MRLSEHAMHTWDVAVVSDPAATVLPTRGCSRKRWRRSAACWPSWPSRRGRFRVRVRTTSPEGDYLLDVGEPVTLSDWVPGSDGGR